jgi:acetyl esterase/lipase
MAQPLSDAQILQWSDVQKLTPPAAGQRIAYGTGPDQFGDLRLPAGSGPFPVVVLIHGGCWRNNINLDNIAHLAAALTRDGYATWSIEYRRADGAGGGWPGTFDDVLAAFDHIQTIATGAKLDMSRVVVAGHSAGGQLALWLGAKRKSAVRSVVSLSGVPDLRGAASTVCTGMIPLLARGDANYSQISPIEMLPLGVPQWIVTAQFDDTVPAKWGAQYAAVAKKKGDRVELVEVNNAGHFELIVPGTRAYTQVRAAIDEAARK